MATVKKRNPFIALLLSLLLSGLGQLYNGQVKKAVIFFAINSFWGIMWLLFLRFMPSAASQIAFWIINFLIGLLLAILITLDAVFSAKKIKEITLQPYNKWYIYLLIMFALTAVGELEPPFLPQYKHYKMASGSMRPTLIERDRLMADRRWFRHHSPQRGDLVVFETPQNALSLDEKKRKVKKDSLKRCVAVGGDTVEIKNKVLFVNGQKMEENYIQLADNTVYSAEQVGLTAEEYQKSWEPGNFDHMPPNIIRDNFGPVLVPPDCIFFLGDNRDRSFDSRFYGPIHKDKLKGKLLFIGFSKELKRIGKKL